jgi:hypothetical protein
MGRSDSRSTLSHFAGTPLIGFVAPSPPDGVALHAESHCWGGDGSLLFPRRLSHHSTSLTPPGSSGLHLQALHPFRGLRPIVPGSAPGCSLSGISFRRGRLRFMLRTGGLHLPKRRLGPTLRRPDLAERRWAATRVSWHLPRPDSHRLVVVSLQDAPRWRNGAVPMATLVSPDHLGYPLWLLLPGGGPCSGRQRAVLVGGVVGAESPRVVGGAGRVQAPIYSPRAS